MGNATCWTGLSLMLISPVFGFGKPFVIAGAIILVIGTILNWLNK
jgi:hypothetical protein